MEKLTLILNLFEKALKTLENSFAVVTKAQNIQDIDLIYAAEDSTIQRFEYCYDSFWKFLKHYLEKKYNFIDINSPKSVFRACVEKKICSEDDGDILIKMIADRNETTHNYDAQQVREIFDHIPRYFAIMQKIFITIKNGDL